MAVISTKQDLETFLAEYQPEMNRLQRLLRCMHSVSDIRYAYFYLTKLKVETTHEFIMHVDAVTTGLVIGYGRLFTATENTTQLSKDIVPGHLRPIHDEIMSLRHERYAHHGAHESVDTSIDIEFDGTSFILTPQLTYKVCFGAPKEWAPLFEWIDGHMFESLKKQLDRLSQKTGFNWKIPSKLAPYWVTAGKNEG